MTEIVTEEELVAVPLLDALLEPHWEAVKETLPETLGVSVGDKVEEDEREADREGDGEAVPVGHWLKEIVAIWDTLPEEDPLEDSEELPHGVELWDALWDRLVDGVSVALKVPEGEDDDEGVAKPVALALPLPLIDSD